MSFRAFILTILLFFATSPYAEMRHERYRNQSCLYKALATILQNTRLDPEKLALRHEIKLERKNGDYTYYRLKSPPTDSIVFNGDGYIPIRGNNKKRFEALGITTGKSRGRIYIETGPYNAATLNRDILEWNRLNPQSPIAVRAYETSGDENTLTFLRHWGDDAALPFSYGAKFFHDRAYHMVSAILLPPHLVEISQQVTRVVLRTNDFAFMERFASHLDSFATQISENVLRGTSFAVQVQVESINKFILELKRMKVPGSDELRITEKDELKSILKEVFANFGPPRFE